ncbi:MAG: hydrogenase maturation nickel metallochaperone HypA [Verrucomicrobiota bacterium]
MHELAITQELIATACERSQGAKIKRLVVEIGKLSAVLPEAMRFCFDLCCEGTAAQGASLEIIEKPGRARCRACHNELELEQPFGYCACGSSDLDWLSGEELRLKEMEVC